MLHLTLRTCAILLLCAAAVARADDCAAYDSCAEGGPLRTCECAPSCVDRGTCCADFDGNDKEVEPTMLCRQEDVASPVFAKRRCAAQYDGHDRNQLLCEDALDDPADVLVNAPVTSPSTMVTYWNKFCAICNGENERMIKQWMVVAVCPSRHDDLRISKSQVLKNLTFDRDSGEWGLEMPHGFLICSVLYVQPNGFSGKLDYCLPNIVSKCPKEADHDTASKCSRGPNAERRHKTSGEYFRNEDCALCHGVPPEDLECVGRPYGPVKVVPDSGDLVRVLFSAGRWVTREVPVCSFGNSWDPFSNACRRTPSAPKGPFWTQSGAALATDPLTVMVVLGLILLWL